MDTTKIIEKARKVIEYGVKEEMLTAEELDWLEENGGAFYCAYKIAIEVLNKKESGQVGVKEDER